MSADRGGYLVPSLRSVSNFVSLSVRNADATSSSPLPSLYYTLSDGACGDASSAPAVRARGRAQRSTDLSAHQPALPSFCASQHLFIPLDSLTPIPPSARSLQLGALHK